MLYRLWLRLLGLDRASGVLKNFNRTIARLDRAKKYQEGECERWAARQRTAEVYKEMAQQEALKANTVATKLRGIVGL